MAIGDYHNDIYLFREAGFKVAMKDSVEILKNSADYVTKRSNNEDGVAEALSILLDG
ncbi:MAG: HAD family hydrolase [Fidelibacterota bacterium]